LKLLNQLIIAINFKINIRLGKKSFHQRRFDRFFDIGAINVIYCWKGVIGHFKIDLNDIGAFNQI